MFFPGGWSHAQVEFSPGLYRKDRPDLFKQQDPGKG